MLEEPDCLLLHQLRDHIAENGAHSVEPLVRRADIRQANVVQQYFLHDEDRDSLAELGSRLHDAKAEGNNLRSEEEVDNIRRVILHQRTDDAQRGEAEVLEGTRLGCRVQKRVEKEGDVS